MGIARADHIVDANEKDDMKERPILMKPESVRAILEGRKTQTRRIVKPQPQQGPIGIYGMQSDDRAWSYPKLEDRTSFRVSNKPNGPDGWSDYCPYGIPSDRLWVKETWGCPSADHPRCKDGRKPIEGDKIVYLANPSDEYQWGQKGHPGVGDFCWRSPLYMPRWASRLTLEIANVRVERLQEISYADSRAEGMAADSDALCMMHFQSLWDSINAKKYPWASNPWVWIIEFKNANEKVEAK